MTRRRRFEIGAAAVFGCAVVAACASDEPAAAPEAATQVGGDAGGATAADGTTTSGDGPTASRVTPVRDVGVGLRFGCALLHRGSVWCWGRNDTGTVKRPPAPSTSPPTRVAGL